MNMSVRYISVDELSINFWNYARGVLEWSFGNSKLNNDKVFVAFLTNYILEITLYFNKR